MTGAELIAAWLSLAQDALDEGASWRNVCRVLGVSRKTLVSWGVRAPDAPILPVVHTGEPGRPVADDGDVVARLATKASELRKAWRPLHACLATRIAARAWWHRRTELAAAAGLTWEECALVAWPLKGWPPPIEGRAGKDQALTELVWASNQAKWWGEKPRREET
jgi:hypothetical protein